MEEQELTPSQVSGAKGGKTTAERHGAEYMREIGRRGGRKTQAEHGPDHYKTAGAKGGRTTVEERGPSFMSEIGKRGGAAVRKLIEEAQAARKEGED